MSLLTLLLLASAALTAFASLAGLDHERLPGVQLAAWSPRAWLQRRRAAAAVVDALPDALRRLAAEVSAGRTVERALASTGALAPRPLGSLLEAAARDLGRGRALDDSLAARLPADPACTL